MGTDDAAGAVAQPPRGPFRLADEAHFNRADVAQASTELLLNATGKPVEPSLAPCVRHDEVNADIASLDDDLLYDSDIDEAELALSPRRPLDVELKFGWWARSASMTLSRLIGLGAGGGLTLGNWVEKALLVVNEVREAAVISSLFVPVQDVGVFLVHVLAGTHRRELHRIADPSAGVRESGVGRLRPARIGVFRIRGECCRILRRFRAVEMGHPARILALPASRPQTNLSLRSHPSSFR